MKDAYKYMTEAVADTSQRFCLHCQVFETVNMLGYCFECQNIPGNEVGITEEIWLPTYNDTKEDK